MVKRIKTDEDEIEATSFDGEDIQTDVADTSDEDTVESANPEFDPMAGADGDDSDMEALLMGLGGGSGNGPSGADEGFDVNFDELVVTLVSQGTYPARILEAEFGKSKSSGNNMITIEWMILKGAFSGRTLRSWVVFTEGNVRRVAQFFKATMGDEAQGSKRVRRADLLNRMAMIEITHGPDNRGETRENINNVLPYEGGVGRHWKSGIGLDDLGF